MNVTIEDVKEFWGASPCQSDLSTESDRRAYFEDITRRRYGGREWHVPRVAQFETFTEKDVLEVGCGIGTDGFEFAVRGARYTGVDLTEEAVAIAKERFELFGVDGRFRVADAEHGLPFPADSFDHVYSFGVIHHSPRPEAIVEEIHRVLRPGGTFTVMLYNRSSINYYIEIMALRRVFRLILYPKGMPRLLATLTGFDQRKLEGHRRLLRENGRISRERWVSMNTDGPHCPLARVFGRSEAKSLFASFVHLEQEVWEFNTDHWAFVGRLIPDAVAQSIGRRWGWHRVVRGQKEW